MAMNPESGALVTVPPDWQEAAAELLTGDGALDHFAQESMGHVVATFGRAKQEGRAVTNVTMAGGERQLLELFDLADHYGFIAAFLTPTTLGATDEDFEVPTLIPTQAIYHMNASGIVTWVSPEFCLMFGWEEDEVVGRSTVEFVHADDHDNSFANWIEVLERPGKQVRLRQRRQTKGGDWLWCEQTNTNLLGQPETNHVLAQTVNVSREMAAQTALQDREQLLDRLNQALPTGILHIAANRRVLVQNQRWEELIGPFENDGLSGLLGHLTEPTKVEYAISKALADGLDIDLAVTFDGTGRCQFGELHLRPLRHGGIATGLLLTLDDVTKLASYQVELAEQARRDPLTGVYNRLGIEELVGERLNGGAVDDHGLTVLFVDLDRFKQVNDQLGHVAGDRVLQAVAACIQQQLRPGDHVGRIGGDEFLVILGPATKPGSGPLLADRIGAALPEMAGQFCEPLTVGASIGVAAGLPGDSFDSILKRADADMYERKRERHGRSEVIEQG